MPSATSRDSYLSARQVSARLLTNLLHSLIVFVTMKEISAARGPPEVSSSYTKRHLLRSGETLRLTCPVESDPLPLIEWQKDGETIHLGWSRFRLTDNAIRVKDLEIGDTGVYVCKATNGFGTVDVNFQIYVYAQGNSTGTPSIDFDEYFKDTVGPGEIPSFVRTEQMKEHHLVLSTGSTARLRCRATGRPAPDIVWYKDGVVLPEALSSSLSVDGDSNHWQLRLPDLKISDSGKFTCKVFNKFGAINFTYTLQVLDPLSKPMIQDLQNLTVAAGDTLVLQCHIYSRDHPKVEWLKRLDGQTHRRHEHNVTITIQNERYMLIQPGGVTMSTKENTYLNKLVIVGAREQDSGMYLCSCASSMGFSFQSTFVTVLPDGVSGYHDQDQDDIQGSYAFLPIIIALTAVFGLVFLLIIIYVIHRRHVDSRRRKPATSELPRAPTTTSSFVSQLVEKQNDHYCAMLQQSHVSPSRTYSSQEYALDNSFQATKNYVVDARSDYSSISKSPIMQQLIHAQQQQQQQQQQYPQIHRVASPQHLQYPLL